MKNAIFGDAGSQRPSGERAIRILFKYVCVYAMTRLELSDMF